MIPVFDIKRQNRMIGKEIRTAIDGVINNGIYILGDKVRKFEAEFAKYIGVKYAVGVGNGTDAISLALLALGIKAGDGVIMPANSYPSVFALTSIGIVPQLVDIDPRTFTIDPSRIEKAINRKTKVILPVHMYGQPADMEAILAIGKRYNLPIIEDCAQAHGSSIKYQVLGSRYKSEKIKKIPNTYYLIPNTENKSIKQNKLEYKKTGSIGILGCFSFYPTKNLGCFGDGGMVVTNDKRLADKVRLLRMYGEDRRYHSVIPGRNTRLDELQAAILLVKLRYLDSWNNSRRNIAELYKVQSSKFPPALAFGKSRWRAGKVQSHNSLPAQVGKLKAQNHNLNLITNNQQLSTFNFQLPKEADYTRHIYHLFVIRTTKRDQLKAYLEKKGIMTAIHYPLPVHLIPSMKYLGYKKGDFPQSEKACEEVLSLPMFPELKKEEVERVVNEIKKFYD